MINPLHPEWGEPPDGKEYTWVPFVGGPSDGERVDIELGFPCDRYAAAFSEAEIDDGRADHGGYVWDQDRLCFQWHEGLSRKPCRYVGGAADGAVQEAYFPPHVEVLWPVPGANEAHLYRWDGKQCVWVSAGAFR